MINPLTVMKLINERHQFVQNHMDFFPFLKEGFGEGVEAGTKLKMEIVNPDGTTKTIELEIQESELPLFKTLSDLLGQIA